MCLFCCLFFFLACKWNHLTYNCRPFGCLRTVFTWRSVAEFDPKCKVLVEFSDSLVFWCYNRHRVNHYGESLSAARTSGLNIHLSPPGSVPDRWIIFGTHSSKAQNQTEINYICFTCLWINVCLCTVVYLRIVLHLTWTRKELSKRVFILKKSRKG